MSRGAGDPGDRPRIRRVILCLMSDEGIWARARRARRARQGCPPWQTFSEACVIVLCGGTARIALPVAFVVGTLVSVVNQGTGRGLSG